MKRLSFVTEDSGIAWRKLRYRRDILWVCFYARCQQMSISREGKLVATQYRTASDSDRMLSLNEELSLGSGRYRSRFCIEGRGRVRDGDRMLSLNEELRLGSGRYRSRFCIEGRGRVRGGD